MWQIALGHKATSKSSGSSRSSTLVPIESAYATSYQSLIVTLVVSGTVFEILTHKARKHHALPTSSLFEFGPRMLCYCKDDCAMRPIYWCSDKFRDSLTTPVAIFFKTFHGLLFRSTLWMCLQNLKSEIIGVAKHFGQSLVKPALPIFKNAIGFLVPTVLLRALVFPQCAIGVLGGICEPPILEKRRP